MSERLRDRIAAEHRTYGFSCECGHHPQENEGIMSARTRHLIAVTEQAVRAEVAERIAQGIDDARRGAHGKAPGHYAGLAHAARIARNHRSTP